MTALTIPPRSCLHLADGNDTTWTSVEQFSYISEALIQPTIFSVGIITNILSVIILVGVKMNKVFRLCLISLTISDLLSTIFGLMQILIEVIVYCGEVPEGHLLTPVIINNAFYMTFLAFMSTSATIVVFIAFIRNMICLKPIKSRIYFTTKIIRRTCAAIFVITLSLYLPTCLQVTWLACYKEIAMTSQFCANINKSTRNLKQIANGYLHAMVMIYGPVMLLAYVANLICIWLTLNNNNNNNAIHHVTVHLTCHENHRRQLMVNRTTKMLSLILICDVICTLPSIIQGIGLLFAPEDGVFEKKILFFEILDPVAEILLALRPTYNFWLYVFQKPEFRIRLCELTTSVARRCCRHYDVDVTKPVAAVSNTSTTTPELTQPIQNSNTC